MHELLISLTFTSNAMHMCATCASNWEWRRIHAGGDGDGPKFGCFAISDIRTSAALRPPLLFGGELISEQQLHAVVESRDADLVMILPNGANGVAAIDGRGSTCLCAGTAVKPVWQCEICVHCTSRHRWERWNAGHAGAQHIRVPLMHSLTKGYRIDKHKVNCKIVGEDRHVEIVRDVKQGCELFVHADAPRAAAVVGAYMCRDLLLSTVVVLVASRPGVPRKSTVSDFEYTAVQASHRIISTWAKDKIIYCYAAMHAARSSAVSQGTSLVQVYNEGDFTHTKCRAGHILHWEDVDNVERRGYSWSEPPSEYVEVVDSTGDGATGNSVFVVHPGHLRSTNERYVQTRKAFGQYVVVNLKKPLREIGVNTELIDRIMTPGEINGQADKHKKFAAYIEGKLQTGNVVVHCCNSRSRTPAVVAVWLMVHRGFSLQTATRMLTELFEDQRPSIVSRSVDCPNFVRFEPMLKRIEAAASDDSTDVLAEPLESPSSPMQSPPRKKNIGNSIAPCSSPVPAELLEASPSPMQNDIAPSSSAAADVDTSAGMLPVVPQTRVVELAEQVLSTFNGERPSAATVKAELYYAGHAEIFEQCDSLGAGDMLGAIEDAIARRYGSNNASCDTGIENQAAPVSNETGDTGIENQAAPVSNEARSTEIESQEVPVSNDPGPPILPQQQVTICDSSGEHSSRGADRCEMMVPRHKGALRCCNTTDLKQQDGRWLCRIHILPDCSLNEHCQFVTAQPLRSNPRTAATDCRGREKLEQPVQLTDAMRDYIRQRFGAHAVSARDQFVCRRCSNAISRNHTKARYRLSSCSRPPSYAQAQQSAITVTQMRKQHGRSSPWLQLARLQSQLNKANATNVQLQQRVSEGEQKATAEKHAARVASVALEAKAAAAKRAFACTQSLQQATHRRVRQRSKNTIEKLEEQTTLLRAREKQLKVRLLESTNLQSGHIRERISRCVATATAKLQKRLTDSQARVHELHEKQAESTAAMRGWKAGRASLASQQRQKAQENGEKLRERIAALRVTMQQKLQQKLIEQRTKQEAMKIEYEKKLLECRAAMETAAASLQAEKTAIAQQFENLKAQHAAQSAELKMQSAELKMTKRKVRTKLHLSNRAKETFADLVAQKHMLGAGRGYNKRGTSCEETRMPIDARTRTVRTMVAAERQKVSKKLSRRVNQFENEACRALGIEQWPPTDPRVLSVLGVDQAEQSKRLHQQLQDLNAKVLQLGRDNETKISRMSQQYADQLACIKNKHASDIAELEVALKLSTSDALKLSMSDSASTRLKIAAHASKRDYERMGDVLLAQNVPCKTYWNQLKEERAMRFGLPVPRMLLDSSQCRKPGCKCSQRVRIMGNFSDTQRFDLCAMQCLAFTRCATTYAHQFRCKEYVDKFIDVVRQILTYVLDAQTPLTRRNRPAKQAIHAAHKQALCNYATGKCPAAVGMDIVEAMQYHMRLAHTTGLADSFFFPDDARRGDDAGPHAASADWYTPQVKQRCNFSETVKLNRAAAAKCPVLAVFCFDGTRIGRDFERPLQQHSWKFANSQSLSVDEVWLTHLCLIDENKENMTPIFRSVHSQLERPQAHKITVKTQERPVHFMCVCDCKANLQVLNQQSNSAHYACSLCTMRSEHMHDMHHQRFTLHEMERNLGTLCQTRNVRQISQARLELQQRQAEMGVSRTPEMAELAALRIEKLVETCSINAGIKHGRLSENATDKRKYAELTLKRHAELLDASRRLSLGKVLQLYSRCMDKDVANCIRTSVNKCLKQRQSKRISATEVYLRLHTLCRVAGPEDLQDLCGTCQDSVEDLCSSCKRAQTQKYIAQRDNGAAGVPMWVLPAKDSWRDKGFRYRDAIRAFANGTLRAGDSHKEIGGLHFSDPDNACVPPTSVEYPCRHCKPCALHAPRRSLTCMECTQHMYTPQHCLDVSARYETYGQLGEPSLRGLDNTAIAPDLLHTIIDLTMTIVKWLVCCTEGCGTDSGSGRSYLYNLGECLVDTNIKAFAWGPLVNLDVNGRHKPTRDALNGGECKFLCDHSDLYLDRTFGKNPIAGGNAHTCKKTMATGIQHLQRLRKWILCKNWQQLLDSEHLSVNPLVELQQSYETLQRWLLTEVSNPVNTNAAIQLGGKSQHGTKETLFQGIAWHNCSHMVYDVAPYIWNMYRLSIGCVTSCQPFEGINR